MKGTDKIRLIQHTVPVINAGCLDDAVVPGPVQDGISNILVHLIEKATPFNSVDECMRYCYYQLRLNDMWSAYIASTWRQVKEALANGTPLVMDDEEVV